MRGSAIVSSKWAANGDLVKQAVGTGPFKIVEYVPQSHIRYVKNPDYWEKGLPYLDEVTFKVAVDEETRIAGLRSGQLQHAAVSPEGAERLASEKSVQVLSSPGPQMWTHLLNVKQKPFDDVRVRQAIALSIDHQAAIEKALGGQGTLTGPMPTGHGDWFIPPEQLGYKRDVVRAKQLLADAGYPNGFESTIKTTPDYPTMLSTSIIMADQLKEIGIRLNVQQMEWGTLVKDINSKDYDIHSNGNSFFPDPDSYMYLKYHTKGAQNFSSWENAQYDALIDKARTIFDSAERKKLYDEAQKILMDEAPLVWWFTENNIEAMHKSQKGYSQSFTGRRMFLKKVWVEE
jgi:peptide/nickel transport system substrate-binding protein